MYGIFLKTKKLLKPNIIFLNCFKGAIPRFYGLPKIHEVSLPLRPIVSFIISHTYNQSKFLSRILSSILVNRYSVRNFIEFVDYVQNFTISENEILVSFDVVGLFTSVPVDKVTWSRFYTFFLLMNSWLHALLLIF